MGSLDMSVVRTPTLSRFDPSPQQQAVFDWAANGEGSANLIAAAGTGKTTTLKQLIARVLAPRGERIAGMAFNKKAADDFNLGLSALGITHSEAKVATFHSFGFQAWRKRAGSVQVKEEKIKDICQKLSVNWELRAFVGKAVSIAKQSGFGIVLDADNYDEWIGIADHYDLHDLLPEREDEDAGILTDAIDVAITVLEESIAQSLKVIDFDDMIYMPLYENLPYQRYPWILIDEAQDTNVMRRLQAERMLEKGGRAICVGDPCQAIYGFTGANSDAMDLLREQFKCIELPLTVTYRCPKRVVELARTWVSHIEAHESAPDGLVSSIPRNEFEKLLPVRREDAVLCRLTKPLVQLAFHMIRQGTACHVEGREIGKGLITLAQRWKGTRTVGDLEEKLQEYVDKETARLMSRGQDAKAEQVRDKVDTLFCIMEQLDGSDQVWKVKEKIDGLFGDDVKDNVTLSTVHKAKGREWNNVFLLGRDSFMPSRWARQDWQKEQEKNLMYVAVTRAKQRLIDVNFKHSEAEPRRTNPAEEPPV